jgi:hypothetical protein
MSVGVKEAGRRLGIPYRTISHWMVREDSQAVISRSREDVAARAWEVYSLAMDRALAALEDPKTPARDIARILEVTGRELALAEGRATENVATMDMTPQNPLDGLTDQEKRDLRDWIASVENATDEELLAAGTRRPAQLSETVDDLEASDG